MGGSMRSTRPASTTTIRIEVVADSTTRYSRICGGAPTNWCIPSQSEYNDHGRHSHSPFYDWFDSWRDALDAAVVLADE